MTPNVNGVLERFVRRARRIAAHSLLQERGTLLEWAEARMTGTIDLTGSLTVRWPLPADEEVFESLAARLRPLTVGNEPIFYEKVFDAIEAGTTRPFTDAESKRMDALRQGWRDAEVQGSQVRGYAVQMAKSDGTDPTPLVSDTQLAAAWLYDDLVHADARGSKAEALVFDLDERYSAAVRLFSYLALLTVSTLEFVEALRDSGVVQIEDSAWSVDVFVGKSELVHESRGYFAEPGAQAPDIRLPMSMDPNWKPLTVS